MHSQGALALDQHLSTSILLRHTSSTETGWAGRQSLGISPGDTLTMPGEEDEDM